MFDHVTLRVEDLPSAATSLNAVLDELEITQSRETASFAVWGNLALTQRDDDHPITRRTHIALIAASQAQVDHFWQGGIDAGFDDDGPAGPRSDYAEDYYTAFLKDAAGNSFEAVHRDLPLGTPRRQPTMWSA